MNDGWEVDYVRRVLRETDLTPTALAIYALIGAGAATIILS